MGQTPPNPLPEKPLPGLPDGPLTDQQHQEAIKLAKQRIRVGTDLLKAAESHTTHQQQQLIAIKAEQKKLRDEIHNDFVSSLQTYDQWMAQFDQSFTTRLHGLEQKVDQLQARWTRVEAGLASLVARIETLLKPTPQAPPTHTQQHPPPPPAEPDQPKQDHQGQTPPNAAQPTPPLPPPIKQPLASPPTHATDPTPPIPQVVVATNLADMIYRKALERLRQKQPPSPDPVAPQAG